MLLSRHRTQRLQKPQFNLVRQARPGSKVCFGVHWDCILHSDSVDATALHIALPLSLVRLHAIDLPPCGTVMQERKAAVIRAEGESEAAKLISDATRSAGAGMIELRRIEAARDIAGTLAKSGNVAYLPGGNNMLLGLNPSAR